METAGCTGSTSGQVLDTPATDQQSCLAIMTLLPCLLDGHMAISFVCTRVVKHSVEISQQSSQRTGHAIRALHIFLEKPSEKDTGCLRMYSAQSPVR